MKIIFTGGGSGGHFYPIIAVADALNRIMEQEKIVRSDFIFMSESPYDKSLLFKKGIKFKKVPAGKVRRYFSLLNLTDTIKTFIGIIKAVFSVFMNFPDVIFSKGGYAAFPAVFAARVFGIPLIIHDSDAVPGRVNKWSGKFAKRIAISFPSAADYFPEKKTALTGNPVRKDFFIPAKTGAREFLDLEENAPVILIMGGSQGAKKINDVIVDILPELLKKYQIIHQCGRKNLKETKGRAELVLENSPYKSRYHVFDFLNLSALRMSYGAANIAVARASAGVIFEIAASGLPSILIPLSNSAQDHQRANAYAYAKVGAADVVEEANLTPHVLLSEIERLLENNEKKESMGKAAKEFAKPDAAEKIAREILNLALEHA